MTDDSVFLQGVRPGGLTSALEIKILICYLLSSIASPLSGEQIAEVVQSEGIANYFETFNALQDLTQSNHLRVEETLENVDFYTVTSLGQASAASLKNSVPSSVKEKAIASANKMIEMIKKLSENKVCIKRVTDGYIVQCKILDIGSDLLDISLFVGTKEEANVVKKNFLDNPTAVYKAILEVLT